jgi:hypothetical protein
MNHDKMFKSNTFAGENSRNGSIVHTDFSLKKSEIVVEVPHHNESFL